MHKRHYIHACMHGQTRKGRTQPNAIHSRGRQNQHPGKVATTTVEMLGAETLINSVISTQGVCFMTINISNFYLMTPLHRPEFIQIKISDIPHEVIDKYKLREKATKNGSINIRAKRGM
jgi:hypothetical protein